MSVLHHIDTILKTWNEAQHPRDTDGTFLSEHSSKHVRDLVGMITEHTAPEHRERLTRAARYMSSALSSAEYRDKKFNIESAEDAVRGIFGHPPLRAAAITTVDRVRSRLKVAKR